MSMLPGAIETGIRCSRPMSAPPALLRVVRRRRRARRARVQAGGARASAREPRRQGRRVPAARWLLARPCSSASGTCSARDMKLSSLNARSADPHTDVGQPLHVDMGAIPDEQRLLGLQHRLDARRLHARQRRDAHGARARTGGARGRRTCWRIRWRRTRTRFCSPGRAGSIAVMNAHMWHGGTANRTAAPRLAMHAFYCRRDKPQQQYQKRLLRPEVQAGAVAGAARAARARRSVERRVERRRRRAQRVHEVARGAPSMITLPR